MHDAQVLQAGIDQDLAARVGTCHEQLRQGGKQACPHQRGPRWQPVWQWPGLAGGHAVGMQPSQHGFGRRLTDQPQDCADGGAHEREMKHHAHLRLAGLGQCAHLQISHRGQPARGQPQASCQLLVAMQGRAQDDGHTGKAQQDRQQQQARQPLRRARGLAGACPQATPQERPDRAEQRRGGQPNRRQVVERDGRGQGQAAHGGKPQDEGEDASQAAAHVQVPDLAGQRRGAAPGPGGHDEGTHATPRQHHRRRAKAGRGQLDADPHGGKQGRGGHHVQCGAVQAIDQYRAQSPPAWHQALKSMTRRYHS